MIAPCCYFFLKRVLFIWLAFLLIYNLSQCMFATCSSKESFIKRENFSIGYSAPQNLQTKQKRRHVFFRISFSPQFKQQAKFFSFIFLLPFLISLT